MAGISDKALGKLDSKNKFNGGVELEEDYGVNLYSTFYRQYDPQIGRFNGIDALSELSGDMTPYQYAINDPVSWNDPSGLKETKGGNPPGWHQTDYGWLPNIDESSSEPEQFVSWGEWDWLVSGGGGSDGSFGIGGNGGGDNQSQYHGGGNGGGGGGNNNQSKSDDTKNDQVLGPQSRWFFSMANSIDSIPAHYGIGAQGTIGLGAGQEGKQQTLGIFLTSDLTLTLFFSEGYVDKRDDGYILDGSISAQVMFGMAPSGNFDISGDGKNNGFAFDPGSISYSTDSYKHPKFRIAAVGPALGIKFSSASLKTNTSTQSVNLIDFISGIFRREF